MMRARHRLSKLLLRHGIVYYGGTAWTGRHDGWLRQQRFENPTTQLTFESDYDAVLTTTARRDRLNRQIETLAANSEFTPVVRRLWCLRGVSTLTAFGLAFEIGDWRRFTGSTIGSFVGLVPSEHSSGASRVQGSITKTGNGHARRLLVEAAWHHRARYQPGKTIRDRWDLASPAARARGDLGNRRLHARWVKYIDRKKKATVANTPSPASSPAGAGRWPCSRSPPHDPFRWSPSLTGAVKPSREATMSSPNHGATPVPRQAEHSCRNARPAVTNPRISV